ncbi:hypothetical protein GIHI108528_02060 [Gillisia hiemivivida]
MRQTKILIGKSLAIKLTENDEANFLNMIKGIYKATLRKRLV